MPIFVVLIFLLSFLTAQAQETPALQVQIVERSQKVKELQVEISKLQGELNETNKQKQTLQNTLKAIDLNIQKLSKSITLTQTQIAQKDTEIKGLSGDIAHTEGSISSSQAGIADSLRQLAVADGESVAAMIFGGATLSTFFNEAAALSALRQNLQNRVEDLTYLKTNLVTSKSAAETKRSELSSLQRRLNEEKQGLSISRSTQNQLLEQTKNKESNYQTLIAQKQAEEARFEQELQTLEAQLGLHVDRADLPSPGSGVLAWPVAPVFITQYFGNTPFATANPQVYGSKGHNAIDLRASIGTPTKAARGGIVQATGNTDLVRGCYSYGKWVLVRHDNGLTTLYAHLSQVNVSQGSPIGTGETIGYSGMTGYATGPHLHFGVYASQGVKITTLGTFRADGKLTPCANATIPVADPSAYLNPLSYL